MDKNDKSNFDFDLSTNEATHQNYQGCLGKYFFFPLCKVYLKGK